MNEKIMYIKLLKRWRFQNDALVKIVQDLQFIGAKIYLVEEKETGKKYPVAHSMVDWSRLYD